MRLRQIRPEEWVMVVGAGHAYVPIPRLVVKIGKPLLQGAIVFGRLSVAIFLLIIAIKILTLEHIDPAGDNLATGTCSPQALILIMLLVGCSAWIISSEIRRITR